MEQLRFIDFIRIYRQLPKEGFNTLLNQTKYRYIYILPVLLGLFLGFNDVLNKYYLNSSDINAGLIATSIIKEIIITMIFCYFYSWIVQTLNNLFQGVSSQSLIFAVLSYILVPVIFVSILISILKIILFSVFGLQEYYRFISIFLYLLYLGFYIVSIVLLVIGNSIASKLTIIKSIIASSIFPIFITIYDLIF